jgi:hypothetical protein
MAQDIDVYGVARLYIKEYGATALQEVHKNISKYTAAEDSGALKVWYDIEDAVKEILCVCEAVDSVMG